MDKYKGINVNDHINDDSLGLMAPAPRRKMVRMTREERLKDYLSIGMSPKDAFIMAMRGVADDGFPSYEHRSSEPLGDGYTCTRYPPAHEFRHGYSNKEARIYIKEYLERNPSPRIYR